MKYSCVFSLFSPVLFNNYFQNTYIHYTSVHSIEPLLSSMIGWAILLKLLVWVWLQFQWAIGIIIITFSTRSCLLKCQGMIMCHWYWRWVSFYRHSVALSLLRQNNSLCYNPEIPLDTLKIRVTQALLAENEYVKMGSL